MTNKRDGFGHESPFEGDSNDWITPKWIIDAFDSLAPKGERFFDLDPCASLTQPWPTAARMFTERDNGLMQPWEGRVYCNPPYGPHTGVWCEKLAKHGNGIALIFARVETRLWHDFIFPLAAAVLFPAGRMLIARPDGTVGKATSGAPSAIIAYGSQCGFDLSLLCSTRKIPGVCYGTPLALSRKEK